MIADVTRRYRTEESVNQRMNCDVCIGVPCKPLGMLDLQSAEPELFAFGKAVDVIAHAGAHGGKCHAVILQVFGKGHFLEPLVARHQRHREPGSFGHGGIVAGIGGAVPGAVRSEDGGEAEGLRCLYTVEPVAVDKRPAQPVCAAHHAVDHRQDRNRAGLAFQRCHQRGNHGLGQIGPCGIMDEDKGWRIAFQRLQSGAHRTLPARRAVDEAHARYTAQCFRRCFFPVGRDHHHDGRDAGPGQCFNRVAHQRLAAPQGELLGHGPACAQALASGDNNGGDLRRNGGRGGQVHARPLQSLPQTAQSTKRMPLF